MSPIWGATNLVGLGEIVDPVIYLFPNLFYQFGN